ncbi:hypothetical protein Mpt1_c13650 [Candidatus Methanoplasma termitum]|uniref:Uncharacterized protein n=1 Tax=Candidatus Methanoplasma termitum TaxID=1577791 RepID=A0A0A7LI98_9ARCH|nr:HVO_0476 family zinc finger protein [Candidatus Methanoplasma termitum]AIZ57226.1 hypothetical protein Mpt1_c13650 [Candidatus Methanoplasma termitum]MCL2334322.1 hypothetical protein [Candidatus Methanoplasma sp.]
MKNREMPESLYIKCPDCEDITEHDILKGRMGKDNITGTFRCTECGRVFSDTVRIPRILKVKVLFSDADKTETIDTELESNEILRIGDEFYLEDGRRVCITQIEAIDGKNGKKFQADQIKALWVKQFDVLSVKVSVNDGQKTYSVRTPAEPDDEFATGMILSFENFDTIVHAIKTKEKLIKNGTAEAREITRIYGKMRKKRYEVLDLEEDNDPDGFDFDDD